MKIFIEKDYDALSKKAFEIMKETVSKNPQAVLGLATGSSPIGLYQEMIRDHKNGGLSYKDVTTFNLDEYADLPKDHPESYYSFMHTQLFDGLDIPEESIHIPEGETEEDARRYDELLKPADLQILGIGHNGHIGFNEPGTPFDSHTHIVELTERTREANKRFFPDEEVPRFAITQGIGNILKADRILLVASGVDKAQAIADMLKGENPEVPASALLSHPDVIVIVDEGAGSLIPEKN